MKAQPLIATINIKQSITVTNQIEAPTYEIFIVSIASQVQLRMQLKRGTQIMYNMVEVVE